MLHVIGPLVTAEGGRNRKAVTRGGEGGKRGEEILAQAVLEQWGCYSVICNQLWVIDHPLFAFSCNFRIVLKAACHCV